MNYSVLALNTKFRRELWKRVTQCTEKFEFNRSCELINRFSIFVNVINNIFSLDSTRSSDKIAIPISKIHYQFLIANLNIISLFFITSALVPR